MSSLTRTIAGEVLVVDLTAAADGGDVTTRTARTLVKQESLSVMLVQIAPGAHLHEHRADGPISVQPLSGRLQFVAAGVTHDIGAGQLISLASGVPHWVGSTDGASFLLTVAKSGAPSAPLAAADQGTTSGDGVLPG